MTSDSPLYWSKVSESARLKSIVDRDGGCMHLVCHFCPLNDMAADTYTCCRLGQYYKVQVAEERLKKLTEGVMLDV